MPEQNEPFGGRFRLVRRIAAGGMGAVWQAEDLRLGRTVALKLIHPGLSEDQTFVERFRYEARHAAALSHPAIAQVYDFVDGDPAYLIMEFVPGTSLSGLLGDGTALSIADAVALVSRAADGVQAAHNARIVHRDIKPGNILVTPDGEVKLTDFGIARALGDARLTVSGDVVGTPAYLAPELAEGKEAGPPADVYALGVVAYEALSGRKPFQADSPVHILLAHVNQQAPPLPPSIPKPVRDVVAYALNKDPEQRPTAAEFAHALRVAATGETPVLRAGVGRAHRQRRTRALMGAGAAALLVAGGAGVWKLTADEGAGSAHSTSTTTSQTTTSFPVVVPPDTTTSTSSVPDVQSKIDVVAFKAKTSDAFRKADPDSCAQTLWSTVDVSDIDSTDYRMGALSTATSVESLECRKPNSSATWSGDEMLIARFPTAAQAQEAQRRQQARYKVDSLLDGNVLITSTGMAQLRGARQSTLSDTSTSCGCGAVTLN